jgi:hypothetical protein
MYVCNYNHQLDYLVESIGSLDGPAQKQQTVTGDVGVI